MTLLSAFAPVATPQSNALVLGSMPGAKSLQEQRYYAHPRNAFWPVLSACLGKQFTDYDHGKSVLLEKGIALWDVLKHCERPGSLDANIRESSVECNDFQNFLFEHNRIRCILFNGKTAERLFKRHVLDTLDSRGAALPAFESLPSTSPAMAMLSLEQKTEKWREAFARHDIAGISA